MSLEISGRDDILNVQFVSNAAFLWVTNLFADSLLILSLPEIFQEMSSSFKFFKLQYFVGECQLY